jgi:predicted ABC-type ATPase
MFKSTPLISIIAGPNGSGKSTCGPAILKNHLKISEFVNADTIATGLSAFQPSDVAIEASRIMLNRLKTLANRRESFAFETTLSSRTFAPWITKIKKNGYHFSLIYFWLHNADLAVERVSARVRLGGHDIPEQTIRRRYKTSLFNFFSLYQILADNWYVYDNSEENNPVLIAKGELKDYCEVYQEHQWNLLKEQHQK